MDHRVQNSRAARAVPTRLRTTHGAALVLAVLGAALAPTPAASAQEAETAAAAETAKFSPEQIEQIAAPVALYPDALLAQVFMAATYPLEIVQADRWRRANPDVAGADLDALLKDQTWDASVKSLCTFPTVLRRMSENLDWSQDLGDAFLGQREELMAAVQTLRKAALDAAKLASTPEQTVVVEREVVVIRATNPDVIYVPAYSPYVVVVRTYPRYWYPVLYVPPPAGARLVTFAAGVAVGAAIWGGCNWHGHDVDIDVDRHAHFEKNTNVNVNANRTANVNANGRATWNHDPAHRKGVNYKSPAVARTHGSAAGSARVPPREARGRATTAVDRPAAQPKAPPRDRPAARPATDAAARPPAPAAQPQPRSPSAFSGAKDTALDRAASERGSRSRGSSGAGRDRRK